MFKTVKRSDFSYGAGFVIITLHLDLGTVLQVEYTHVAVSERSDLVTLTCDLLVVQDIIMYVVLRGNNIIIKVIHQLY